MLYFWRPVLRPLAVSEVGSVTGAQQASASVSHDDRPADQPSQRHPSIQPCVASHHCNVTVQANRPCRTALTLRRRASTVGAAAGGADANPTTTAHRQVFVTVPRRASSCDTCTAAAAFCCCPWDLHFNCTACRMVRHSYRSCISLRSMCVRRMHNMCRFHRQASLHVWE